MLWKHLKSKIYFDLVMRSISHFEYIVACRMHKEYFNTFHSESMKWNLPSMNLDMSIVANTDISQKIKTG